MCIILTCEPYARPTIDLVDDCFFANPDGAGIAWIEGGKVQISKGFTDSDCMYELIKDIPAESPLMLHMRIATSGGISVATCHPYPICDTLEYLHAPDVECGAAIAHNGVIPGMVTSDGISDTIAFVQGVVTPMWRVSHEVTNSMRRAIMRAASGNRFAVLTSDGTLSRIGRGWQSVTRGIEASNGSWRPYVTKWRDSSFTSLWDDVPDTWDDVPNELDDTCVYCEGYSDCKRWGKQCWLGWDD